MSHRQTAGDGVGDLVELGGVGQQGRRRHLFQECLHQLLLEAYVAEVAAVTYTVPGAGQRRAWVPPRWCVPAFRCRWLLSSSMFWSVVTVTPPSASTSFAEPGEVDLDVVVHADVGEGLDGLHRTDRTAHRVRAVEHRAVRHEDDPAGRGRARRAGHQGVRGMLTTVASVRPWSLWTTIAVWDRAPELSPPPSAAFAFPLRESEAEDARMFTAPLGSGAAEADTAADGVNTTFAGRSSPSALLMSTLLMFWFRCQ